MRLSSLDKGMIHSPIRYLAAIGDHHVPRAPGAYVLIAAPGATFTYPRRNSPVLYIGKASNLRRRLQEHARFIDEATYERRKTMYWPMYEYGAAFGCRYAFLRTHGRQSASHLESDLLAMFGERYRSWPVANGAGGWDSLLSNASSARSDPRLQRTGS
ncbi:MAG: hypothetical protein ABR998_10580 [Gemmatimonadales bacterium]|jgi:hypothetical protein